MISVITSGSGTPDQWDVHVAEQIYLVIESYALPRNKGSIFFYSPDASRFAQAEPITTVYNKYQTHIKILNLCQKWNYLKRKSTLPSTICGNNCCSSTCWNPTENYMHKLATLTVPQIFHNFHCTRSPLLHKSKARSFTNFVYLLC